jgi:hypothetical protein
MRWWQVGRRTRASARPPASLPGSARAGTPGFSRAGRPVVGDHGGDRAPDGQARPRGWTPPTFLLVWSRTEQAPRGPLSRSSPAGTVWAEQLLAPPRLRALLSCLRAGCPLGFPGHVDTPRTLLMTLSITLLILKIIRAKILLNNPGEWPRMFSEATVATNAASRDVEDDVGMAVARPCPRSSELRPSRASRSGRNLCWWQGEAASLPAGPQEHGVP